MKLYTILKILAFVLIINYAETLRIQNRELSETIPKIADIKKELLLGNTAKHIIENGLIKSDIENNPMRYKILSASENAANDMTGAKVYENDKKPYYGGEVPVAAKSGDFVVSPKIYAAANNRYLGKSIYSADQVPYYGTGQDFKVLSNAPKDRIHVPVELKELTNTFADEKNIKILENKLKVLTAKESLNSVSLSGKYIKDSSPYYDPSADEKRAKASEISLIIENMKSELSKDKKGPVFTEENFSVKSKIQNYANLNREATNNFIRNSYYYDPKGKEATPKTTVFNVGEKAESKKHKLVEVDTMADNLGSKYVENTRVKLTEADVKDDASNTKNVEPHIVPHLKIIAKKIESEIKVKPITKNKSNPVQKKIESINQKIDKTKKEDITNIKTEKIHEPKKEKITTPKIDIPKVEELKKEKKTTPKIDILKVEEPKKEKKTTPKIDIPKVEEPKKEKITTPKIDIPKVEEPKKEKKTTPKIELIKEEEPKKEKKTTPKIDIPKVEEPKKEKKTTPKIELTKEEESKKEKTTPPKIELTKEEEPKKDNKKNKVNNEEIVFDGFKTNTAELPKEYI